MSSGIDKTTKLNKVGADLAAAFGYSKRVVTRKTTSRKTSVNITIFDGKGISSFGQPIDSVTFNQAAELMRKDGIEGTDLDFDRLLSRKAGVKLSNGRILRDVWAKGSSIPTRYND